MNNYILLKDSCNLFLFVFVVFGGYVPTEKSTILPNKLIRKLAFFLRAFWDISSIFYSAVLIFMCINPQKKTYYVYAIEMSLLMLLRLIIRQRQTKIMEGIHQLNSLRSVFRVEINYRSFIWPTRIIFFVIFYNSMWRHGAYLPKKVSSIYI